MRRLQSFVGRRFGKLIVIEELKQEKAHRRYLCKCDCGNTHKAFQVHLKRHLTTKCRDCNLLHGMSQSSEFKTWSGMKDRCYNKNHMHYKSYGGRGIEVCEKWKESFKEFYADMGKRPEGKTLDRIDNDGNYTPENCKWSTLKEQGNNRRTSRLYKVNGQVLKATDLMEKFNISRFVVWYMTKHNKYRYGIELVK